MTKKDTSKKPKLVLMQHKQCATDAEIMDELRRVSSKAHHKKISKLSLYVEYADTNGRIDYDHIDLPDRE